MDTKKEFVPTSDNGVQWISPVYDFCKISGRSDFQDGFYFATPFEELIGPYNTLKEAQEALAKEIF